MEGILTNDQIHQASQQQDGNRRRNGEASAAEEQTELIDNQGDGVRERALIANRSQRPLGIVELTLHRADGREAGSAQEVENHEGIRRQTAMTVGGLVERRRNRTEGFRLLFLGHVLVVNNVRRVIRAIQDTQHANDFFLRNQTHDCSDRGRHIAEAQRLEHHTDRVADLAKDGVVQIYMSCPASRSTPAAAKFSAG